MGHCLVLSCLPLSLVGLIYACSILVLYFCHLHAAFVHLFLISFCHFSYTRYAIMPRLSKFNNAKKRWKTSALKLQHANRWKISKAKCCACGKKGSNRSEWDGWLPSTNHRWIPSKTCQCTSTLLRRDKYPFCVGTPPLLHMGWRLLWI